MTGEAAPYRPVDARTQLGLRDSGAHSDSAATADRLAKIAFAMSLCGIVVWGCALVGLVLGLVARRMAADQGAPRRRLVTASIVIGAIPVGLGVLVLLAVFVYVALSG